MTWLYATVLLLLAAPFVLWPLLRRPAGGDHPTEPRKLGSAGAPGGDSSSEREEAGGEEPHPG